MVHLILYHPYSWATSCTVFPIILFHIILYFILIHWLSLLHSPNFYHQYQLHETNTQPGEDSIFTEESRSTSLQCTHTCIEENSQSSFCFWCFAFSYLSLYTVLQLLHNPKGSVKQDHNTDKVEIDDTVRVETWPSTLAFNYEEATLDYVQVPLTGQACNNVSLQTTFVLRPNEMSHANIVIAHQLFLKSQHWARAMPPP